MIMKKVPQMLFVHYSTITRAAILKLEATTGASRVLIMLGKVQFELQKLVDGYRSHIGQTITTPSESLLNELQTVEDMKRQCDEKRNIYEDMMAAQREKGKSRSAKGESISSQQLQTAQEEYDEEATLFVFRMKSLKQGQSRSLLTQAARHHAAQLNFFKKGLQSLEAVEEHVKLVTEQQHIDYQFSGLDDDDDVDDGDYDDGDYDDGYDANDNGELSFDYGQNDHRQQDVVLTSRNSMELDQVNLAPVSTMETTKENLDKNQGDLHPLGRGPWAGSQSAPIFADKKFDPTEIGDMRFSSTRKPHTYVLPTPVDHKNSTAAVSNNPVTDASARTHNLWHSSPLEPKKHVKDSKYDQSSDHTHILNAQSVLKESNINTTSIEVPPLLAEGFSLPQLDPHNASDNKKIKRHAFSGPLTSKAWPSKPIISSSGPISSVEHPQLISTHGRVPMPQPSTSPKVSPSASPPLMSSPKISELHELPRPPAKQVRTTRPSSLIGHSAPLVSRSQELSVTSKRPSMALHSASPLPTPPGAFPRSFSIPSSGQRASTLNVPKLEAPHNLNITDEVASPPLTPISFPNIQPQPPASELTTRPGKTRGVD
ncbi:uncharacterized protein At2g33490-like isoform X2 [Tasmannia lanceolata]|uniref:uncharacterized protein At2g33490-like isoform X2 n=1 Tax=Tasmannia lanceolata TaxID=3420 RepID=UPI004063004D